MSDTDLEKALDQVKKEIKASRQQPDTPESTTTKKETAMATEKTNSKKQKSEKTEKAAAPVDGYTSTQLAEELGMDSTTLRKGLRAIDAKKPGGRWVWPKKSDPDLAEIRKQLKEWAAEPKASKEKPAKKDKSEKAPKEKKGNDKKESKKDAKEAPAKKSTKKVVKKADAAKGSE